MGQPDEREITPHGYTNIKKKTISILMHNFCNGVVGDDGGFAREIIVQGDRRA